MEVVPIFMYLFKNKKKGKRYKNEYDWTDSGDAIALSSVKLARYSQIRLFRINNSRAKRFYGTNDTSFYS